MNLPKSFVTVTPFSKFVALSLIVLLPFLGFYLGIKYIEWKKELFANRVGIIKSDGDQKAGDTYEKEVREVSLEIMAGLKNKDFSKIAPFVSDKYQLRLSPYYTVGNWALAEVESDLYPRKLNKKMVENFTSDLNVYFWGYQDGSGFPIEQTNMEYYSDWLFNVDYSKADSISYNKTISTGNNFPLEDLIPQMDLQNKEVHFIEYYVESKDPELMDFDWNALAFVFVRESNEWILVAIMHNEWTI